MKAFFLIIALFVLNFTSLFSIQDFVNRIPNGKVYSCLNCHSSPNGGEATVHLFGKDFKANKSIWNAKLALKDSDGDGVPNGLELQDSAGVWKTTDNAPGNINLVTNPSNVEDFITSVVQNDDFAFEIQNLFPMPAKDRLTISLKLNKNGFLNISLISIDGKNLGNLFYNEVVSGDLELTLNLNDLIRESLSNGVYFIEVKHFDAKLRRRFILNK